MKALQQSLALPLCPPGPACNLSHQLKRPLRRAQIRTLQTKIRINHPNQRQMREVMPFGDQLRAQHETAEVEGRCCPSALAVQAQEAGWPHCPGCGAELDG